MLKRKNDRQPPQSLDELYPDDYWLDEEDGEEELPDPAMKRRPVSGRLHDEPMVTGYEALERQRGVRRPNRKLTRREKKALKRAQKYEEKLHKEHEKADKKNAKREAKLAARAEKQAVRDAKKNAKKKKSRPVAAPSGQRPAGKVVSRTKGSGTGKKTPDSARDKRITAQQSIPYHEMGRDGICRVQDKFYSKTIRFYDINYQLAQNEDKNAIFENWCDFLNYFDSTIHFQLSFINQHSNMAEYEKVIHINPQEDAFDDLRMEFAQMLNNQLAKGNNGLMRTKYITFGIEAENIREARPKLERIESDILNNFKILGVSAYPLNGEERLQIMYETFNQDSKVPFHFSYDDVLRTGLSTKDYVAPTSFVFKNGKDFEMGGTMGAVSYLQILAPELTDKMLAEFLEMDSNLMVNFHIQSIDQMKAIKLVKSKVTDINRMKIEEQKKAVRAGYDMDIIPSDLNTFIVTKDDIIVCDPEGEYYPLVRAFHGQVIRISPTSHDYINPMDINLDYADDDDPLSLKSDFILSLCEPVVGGKNGLEPVEKTVIDRCVRLVYQDFLSDPVPEKMPILEDLYNLLRNQKEQEAQRLATALEIYVNGSLKVFNHRTNVELSNRIVCFDIKDLGKQLKKLGMLIVLDQVWNRVTINRSANKSTRYYIDEFHLLLKEEQTAAYSVEIWKRFRKWGGIPTGITQNVKDLLASREIENIFENSDFILMLNQASGDRQILAKQLNISPHQLSYVTNSGEGEGLVFYGSTIIPFKDKFDNSLMLYALMTSKPDEVEKRKKLGIGERND